MQKAAAGLQRPLQLLSETNGGSSTNPEVARLRERQRGSGLIYANVYRVYIYIYVCVGVTLCTYVCSNRSRTCECVSAGAGGRGRRQGMIFQSLKMHARV